MIRLTTEPVEELHLLSLLIRERLQASLRTTEGQTRVRTLKGTVGLLAGGMVTRISFDTRSVHIDQGDFESAQARASGSLAAFLAVCRGRVGALDVLRGQVRVRGKPRLLAKVMPLLKSDHDPSTEAP